MLKANCRGIIKYVTKYLKSYIKNCIYLLSFFTYIIYKIIK